MVQLNNNFNAEDVDPGNSFDVVEEGWYTAQLEKSEQKETKAGDGSYLSFMFKILEGERKGRTVYTNLNTENPNPVAVEIAERNLSQLCHAAGVLVLEDTEELHGIPVEIKVSITPAQGKFDARNDIKGYRALEEAGDFEEVEEEEEQPKPKKKVVKKKVAAKKKVAQKKVSEEEEDEVPAWMQE